MLVALLAACQPVDTAGMRSAAVEDADGTPLGAPDEGLPSTLAGLLDAAGRAAAEWQDRAVPVEITVELASGRWDTAQVTYLAPESDRLLRYAAEADGAEQTRPTLATLSLRPVTAAGLDDVPPPPEGILDPDPLLEAASAALAACDVRGESVRVSYATGAPFAWDGARWTQRPRWTATISDGSRFAVVDPVTGRGGDACGALGVS